MQGVIKLGLNYPGPHELYQNNLYIGMSIFAHAHLPGFYSQVSLVDGLPMFLYTWL
jgi:hypothetical protein